MQSLEDLCADAVIRNLPLLEPSLELLPGAATELVISRLHETNRVSDDTLSLALNNRLESLDLGDAPVSVTDRLFQPQRTGGAGGFSGGSSRGDNSPPSDFFADRCSGLRSVRLTPNLHGSISAIVMRLAQHCPALAHLDATNCRSLEEGAAKAVSSKCLRLESLVLAGCPLIDGSFLTALTQLHSARNHQEGAASGAPLRRLRTISFASCQGITDTAVCTLLLLDPPLACLDLGQCSQIGGSPTLCASLVRFIQRQRAARRAEAKSRYRLKKGAAAAPDGKCAAASGGYVPDLSAFEEGGEDGFDMDEHGYQDDGHGALLQRLVLDGTGVDLQGVMSMLKATVNVDDAKDDADADDDRDGGGGEKEAEMKAEEVGAEQETGIDLALENVRTHERQHLLSCLSLYDCPACLPSLLTNHSNSGGSGLGNDGNGLGGGGSAKRRGGGGGGGSGRSVAGAAVATPSTSFSQGAALEAGVLCRHKALCDVAVDISTFSAAFPPANAGRASRSRLQGGQSVSPPHSSAAAALTDLQMAHLSEEELFELAVQQSMATDSRGAPVLPAVAAAPETTASPSPTNEVDDHASGDVDIPDIEVAHIRNWLPSLTDPIWGVAAADSAATPGARALPSALLEATAGWMRHLGCAVSRRLLPSPSLSVPSSAEVSYARLSTLRLSQSFAMESAGAGSAGGDTAATATGASVRRSQAVTATILPWDEALGHALGTAAPNLSTTTFSNCGTISSAFLRGLLFALSEGHGRGLETVEVSGLNSVDVFELCEAVTAVSKAESASCQRPGVEDGDGFEEEAEAEGRGRGLTTLRIANPNRFYRAARTAGSTTVAGGLGNNYSFFGVPGVGAGSVSTRTTTSSLSRRKASAVIPEVLAMAASVGYGAVHHGHATSTQAGPGSELAAAMQQPFNLAPNLAAFLEDGLGTASQNANTSAAQDDGPGNGEPAACAYLYAPGLKHLELSFFTQLQGLNLACPAIETAEFPNCHSLSALHFVSSNSDFRANPGKTKLAASGACNLSLLNLYRCNLTDFSCSDCLVPLLDKNSGSCAPPRLRHLNLAKNERITDSGLGSVLRLTPNLEVLKVNKIAMATVSARAFGIACAPTVAALLPSSSLTVLHIGKTKAFTASHLELLARSCVHLQIIELHQLLGLSGHVGSSPELHATIVAALRAAAEEERDELLDSMAMDENSAFADEAFENDEHAENDESFKKAELRRVQRAERKVFAKQHRRGLRTNTVRQDPGVAADGEAAKMLEAAVNEHQITRSRSKSLTSKVSGSVAETRLFAHPMVSSGATSRQERRRLKKSNQQLDVDDDMMFNFDDGDGLQTPQCEGQQAERDGEEGTDEPELELSALSKQKHDRKEKRERKRRARKELALERSGSGLAGDEASPATFMREDDDGTHSTRAPGQAALEDEWEIPAAVGSCSSGKHGLSSSLKRSSLKSSSSFGGHEASSFSGRQSSDAAAGSSGVRFNDHDGADKDGAEGGEDDFDDDKTGTGSESGASSCNSTPSGTPTGSPAKASVLQAAISAGLASLQTGAEPTLPSPPALSSYIDTSALIGPAFGEMLALIDLDEMATAALLDVQAVQLGDDAVGSAGAGGLFAGAAASGMGGSATGDGASHHPASGMGGSADSDPPATLTSAGATGDGASHHPEVAGARVFCGGRWTFDELIQHQALAFFREPTAAELVFPPTLSRAQRKRVHLLASQVQLRHVSQGKGSVRHTVLWKDSASPLPPSGIERRRSYWRAQERRMWAALSSSSSSAPPVPVPVPANSAAMDAGSSSSAVSAATGVVGVQQPNAVSAPIPTKLLRKGSGVNGGLSGGRSSPTLVGGAGGCLSGDELDGSDYASDGGGVGGTAAGGFRGGGGSGIGSGADSASEGGGSGSSAYHSSSGGGGGGGSGGGASSGVQEPLLMPSLIALRVTGCGSLTSMAVSCPRLVHATFASNGRLLAVDVQSSRLLSFDASGCERFRGAVLATKRNNAFQASPPVVAATPGVSEATATAAAVAFSGVAPTASTTAGSSGGGSPESGVGAAPLPYDASSEWLNGQQAAAAASLPLLLLPDGPADDHWKRLQDCCFTGCRCITEEFVGRLADHSRDLRRVRCEKTAAASLWRGKTHAEATKNKTRRQWQGRGKDQREGQVSVKTSAGLKRIQNRHKNLEVIWIGNAGGSSGAHNEPWGKGRLEE